MGTSNGGVIADLAPSAVDRSQHQQGRQSSRRPPRACTARTASRLAPAAPSVERTFSRKHHGHGRSHSSRSADSDPPFTPMVLNPPPPPDRADRWHLRSMWELASIVNFLNVFRPLLNINVEFSIDELESALLTPNALLDAIHIALLKAIPPISRNPLSHETWVPNLCKKMKDRWYWVAEGSFPLTSYHGEENTSYRKLDPNSRVVILKALCEARLEQDDVRAFIDEILKQGAPLSGIRKERIGIDTQGTTYWYENDAVAGQRLYRELRRSDNKDKSVDRGRLAAPPATSQWETLATDLDEFLSVAGKLCGSRNRMEIAVGKRINNDIIPGLKELQKKKERALKKQQRQALLLDTYWKTDSITAGRPRRDRKPVTYTFDDYDKSISEAIKITKFGEVCGPNFGTSTRKRNASPDMPTASERKMSNGDARQHSEEMDTNSLDDDEFETSSGVKHSDATRLCKQQDNTALSSDSELSGAKQFGRGRRLRKPQRYAESDFVETFDNDAGISSEEDIEGEAVYDDDYVSKKRRLVEESSDEDDEYRGDEDDEEDIDGEDEEDDDDYFGSSEEEENNLGRRRSKSMASSRTRAKTKAKERFESGLRRSQRATRSHIDYSKYEESGDEGDDIKDAQSAERSDSDEGAAALSNVEDMKSLQPQIAPLEQLWARNDDAVEDHYDPKDPNQDHFDHRTGKGVYALEELQDGEASRRPTNGQDYDPVVDLKPDVKVHRFLDLNVAAPMAGGLDDNCSKGYNYTLPFMVEKFENSGDNGSTCGSPKLAAEWPKR